MADPAVNAGLVRGFRTHPRTDEFSLGQGLAAPYLAKGASQFGAKRLLDLAIILAVSPVVLLIILVSAVFIWFEDRRPVFFSQDRVGWNGAIFKIYKLRTMRPHQQGAAYTRADDDRITRVGRFLRRHRIDELPQLFNVLRGEMSICGPRPEVVELSRRYEAGIPGYRRRHGALPGLTGWAQVHQGYAVGVDACSTKLSYDLYYMANASFLLDVKILYQTVWVVLRGHGVR